MSKARVRGASAVAGGLLLAAACVSCGSESPSITRHPTDENVIGVEAGDAEMAAAAAEARRRWPEFLAALHRRGESDYFAVKAPFRTADGSTEYIWIDVERVKDGRVHGTLGNEPVGDVGVAYRDPVDKAAAEIEDWLIARDGEIVAGGFQTEVLRKRSGG